MYEYVLPYVRIGTNAYEYVQICTNTNEYKQSWINTNEVMKDVQDLIRR